MKKQSLFCQVLAWFAQAGTGIPPCDGDPPVIGEMTGASPPPVIEVPEKIGQLKMTAPDGKQRFTDCADTETLFRVIQSIPSPKVEPLKRLVGPGGPFFSDLLISALSSSDICLGTSAGISLIPNSLSQHQIFYCRNFRQTIP